MAKDSVTLDSVKSRLNHFRNSRKSPKQRIPEEIWAEVSILCGRIGLKKTASALDIPADRMSRMIKKSDSQGLLKKEAESCPSKDIEVLEMGKIGQLFVPPITIEFEVGTMSRVRVQCAASEILAIGRLLKSLEGANQC
jgi:hypothetical protein